MGLKSDRKVTNSIDSGKLGYYGAYMIDRCCCIHRKDCFNICQTALPTTKFKYNKLFQLVWLLSHAISLVVGAYPT